MTDMNSDPSGTNSICILQWNINGLKAHLPTLTLALAENRYNVAVLQETLLKTHINLTNYTGFQNFYRYGIIPLPTLLLKLAPPGTTSVLSFKNSRMFLS